MDDELRITAWIGVAAFPSDASTANDLLERTAWVFQLSGGGEAYVDATSGVYLGAVFG